MAGDGSAADAPIVNSIAATVTNIRMGRDTSTGNVRKLTLEIDHGASCPRGFMWGESRNMLD